MSEYRTISIRDTLLTVYANEDISNAIVRDNNFYEFEILDYLAQNYFKHQRIIDVGANIGNHSVYFANYLEATSIVAFEPEKNNFDLLLINIQNNKADKIQPVNGALTNYTGQIGLTLFNQNLGMHQVHLNDPGDYLVDAYTLDGFLYNDITLIKIDVEYHEPYVLEGAKETTQRCKPLILIEDTDVRYAPLLPDYELLKSWESYRTYLYGWKND